MQSNPGGPPTLLLRTVLLATLLAPLGCQNFAPPHQAWTEAQVEGRVVDARSGQPVPDAAVSRVRGPELGDAYAVEKGAKDLQKRATVAVTAADGRFVLPPGRTAYLILESFPSYVVTLKVQRRGYESFQQQFTNVVMGTNGAAPVVSTGDIQIFPSR